MMASGSWRGAERSLGSAAVHPQRARLDRTFPSRLRGADRAQGDHVLASPAPKLVLRNLNIFAAVGVTCIFAPLIFSSLTSKTCGSNRYGSLWEKMAGQRKPRACAGASRWKDVPRERHRSLDHPIVSPCARHTIRKTLRCSLRNGTASAGEPVQSRSRPPSTQARVRNGKWRHGEVLREIERSTLQRHGRRDGQRHRKKKPNDRWS